MYSVGQQVVYGSHGVCTIVDLEQRKVDKRSIPYFVLTPMENPASRFYLPSENPAALSKLRPLESKERLEALWNGPLLEGVWIEQESLRKQTYRELIIVADAATLVTIVRCLHKYKKQLLEAGKKFHLADDNFLRDARRILMGEMSVVMEMDPISAGQFIDEMCERE